MPENTPSVVIYGAGLLGRLLAWRLARSGHPVTVLEKNAERQPTSAAHTAAAMVAPYSERPLLDGSMFQMGLTSLKLWTLLLAELNQDCGACFHMGTGGSLLVAHPADHSQLEQYERDLITFGLFNETSVTKVGREQLATMEPALSTDFLHGIWLADDTWLDNRNILSALQQAAQQHGAQFIFSQDADDADIQGDIVLDCRGMGAKDNFQKTDTPLRGVRGEVCWVESTQVNITRSVRLMHPKYQLYLVPKGQSEQGAFRYILGATEIESEDTSSISVRSALEMLSALYCLSPELAEARITELDNNLRPAFFDHKPRIIQNSQGFSLNGLFRHGFLLAPALLNRFEKDYAADSGLFINMPTLQ